VEKERLTSFFLQSGTLLRKRTARPLVKNGKEKGKRARIDGVRG